MYIKKEIELGGKTLIIESGKLAKQSNGAVMVTYGETMVLVTAVASSEAKEDIDFFPLSVEYRERAFAAGKIPGGFFKREGKPTEKEILSARLIDRPIRPLFPEYYRNETQVAAFVYSYDTENDADVIAAVGASAALVLSNIPFLEPIGEVRVGRIEGNLVINPTESQIKLSDMELVVAGTADSIMMVEGEAKEISENELLEALIFAHQAIKKIVEMQLEMQKEVGKPKMEIIPPVIDENLVTDINALAFEEYKTLVATVLGKEERAEKNKELNTKVQEALAEKYPESEKIIAQVLHDLEKKLMRERILTDGLRLDGRNTTQIRPITCEIGCILRTHGSSLFTRGETQSLTTLTLGTKRDEQIIDGLKEEYTKRFMLHYNFPPFSVGEIGKYAGIGRREVGHGNLAERSLKNIIPPEGKFPYTIRLNSDILESNGSSSMATVCAGSLALMDAGVPVEKAIAGIAMGLIKEGDKYAILTDILGNEDHLGDMDFKVAGSVDGITGFQMDIKIQGISYEIMQKALEQARVGRLHILGIMNETIDKPKQSISQWAPVIDSFYINPESIGAVIGTAGKVIQKIQKDFNVEITIEEDGKVNIYGPQMESAVKAKKYIKLLVAEPEIGQIYTGKVKKIMEFGAFVEILPNKDGLLHVSQISHDRVEKASDVLKEGDEIEVKLIKIEKGKISLSRKVLLENPDKKKRKENSDKNETAE